jgi:16S rRNA (cytosine1402-N4)-methyltransferase
MQCRISELSRLLRKMRSERPVGFLFDFGASSLQLDTPDRGFSFQDDGPLDMRMDPCRVRTAADVVNTWDEDDLADLFYAEGGERKSRPIAAEIVRCRSRAAFQRTGALAELVVRVVGRTGKIHPATRVFQALRRAVNEEGEELLAGLKTAEHWLADGGVLATLSFHSGEDREVKRFLKEGVARDCWRLEPKRPLRASREEQRENPRARSAILRGAVRVRGEDGCE